jgi:plasmid stabilization system protein ParE
MINPSGFSVIIDPRAIQDIQKAIDYYDEQQTGLGRKFESSLNKYIMSLEENPFFSIRYDHVRCLPLKKFPYTVHFSVDEAQQSITILAVFHTAINPKKWKRKKQ